MTNFEYSNTTDLQYWQGIRYLADNYYIMCGTNQTNEGIFYIGDPLNYNSNNNYILSYPNSQTTSLYGPDYIDNGIYRLVGSYQNKDDNNIYGLFYEGTLYDFLNSNNYKTISIGYSYTFIHSTTNNILVGNCDKSNLGPIQAFLMIIDIGKIINISYPGSTSNTVYGIWYNNDSTYTLCGGYSDLVVTGSEIYVGSIIKPFGQAYLVNYDIITNEFSNWTTIAYPYDNLDALTHFQGISSSSKNNYQLAADTIYLGKIITSYVDVNKDSNNEFIVDNWIDFVYPLPAIITSSSNSVSRNIIVGTYVDKENNTSAFQLKIN